MYSFGWFMVVLNGFGAVFLGSVAVFGVCVGLVWGFVDGFHVGATVVGAIGCALCSYWCRMIREDLRKWFKN